MFLLHSGIPDVGKTTLMWIRPPWWVITPLLQPLFLKPSPSCFHSYEPQTDWGFKIQDYFHISSEKLKRGWTLTTSQYTITHIVYFKTQRAVIEKCHNLSCFASVLWKLVLEKRTSFSTPCSAAKGTVLLHSGSSLRIRHSIFRRQDCKPQRIFFTT